MNDLLARAQAWLERLEAEAPDARERADAGDPKPLASLRRRTQAAVAADVVGEPSALRDLEAESPDLHRALSRWLSHEFGVEARWRAKLATAQRPFGETEASLVDLERGVSHADPDTRAAALRAWCDIWAEAARGAKAWRPPPAAAPAEPERQASGLLLAPSAEMVAALSTTGVLAPHLLNEGSAASGAGGETAGLEALVRELAAATGQPVKDFGTWRRAGLGADVAEFTPDHAVRVGGAGRAGRPLKRTTTRRAGPAHEALSLVLHTLLSDAPLSDARALAWASQVNLRRGLRTPPSDRLRAARALALSIAVLALEAAWVTEDRDPEAWKAAFARTWTGSAPFAYAAMATIEADAERVPGEGGAVYARGPRLLQRLCAGARDAMALRERFDEDWPFDPSAELGAPSKAGGLEELTAWLVDAARL